MTRLSVRLLGFVAAVMLGVFAAMVAPPGKAYACDCAGISIARALRQSTAVFRGTVLEKHSVGRRTEARTDIRFQVDAVYKGAVHQEQVVASPREATACGLDPKIGSTWVIFAVDGIEGSGNETVQRLVTTLCSGNVPSGTAPAILGEPRPPLEGASDREEQSINTDRAVTRGLAIGGMVLLVAGALVAIGLVVLWRPNRPR
ncbi:MAG TPA: hypothetical protein VE462_09835 [Propionibacteriaceae bacterium]|nr:hypothetical protein [Propionibacteriaceae bacterium]